ncbi:hypothetical protein K439DRAFT_1623658 [Ramaria rubella]|nr:hypothetical protein K439DRAFT_1623658 [Ramaria rubella]
MSHSWPLSTAPLGQSDISSNGEHAANTHRALNLRSPTRSPTPATRSGSHHHRSSSSRPTPNDNYSSDNPEQSDQEKKPDALSTAACHFGRIHDMWTRFTTILDIRYAYNTDDPEDMYNHKGKNYINLYHLIVTLAPGLPGEIACQGPQYIGDYNIIIDILYICLEHLDHKHSTAGGEDVKHIKDRAQQLHPKSVGFIPPLEPDDKLTRGFKHPELARLVCPVSWLAKFDTKER